MPIIYVKDNEIIDETETQIKKKEKKGTRGTEAIAKGWEINDFIEHLS